ncbi:unnamed protein product [Rhizoctonia solani]|uniref:Zn(2)-C6 fungal-type domain-containing protein n=1 Tax=Rhizoctonia solani TaxID=456999 RepID=A0A8H3GMD9_9AGAM|nr:unnamed protein product [Rhizoctonia solani]
MINTGNAGCVSCEARNKKCDRTRSPSGCRRCAQAGIECGGYPPANSRGLRPKHGSRDNQQASSIHRVDVSTISRSVPMRFLDHSSANSAIDRAESNLDFPYLPLGVPTLHQYTDRLRIQYEQSFIPSFEHVPAPLTRRDPSPITQTPSPLIEPDVGASASQIRAGRSLNTYQASLFDAIFSLADGPPAIPCTSETSSPTSLYDSDAERQDANTRYSQNSDFDFQAESPIDWPTDLGKDTDNKNLQLSLLNTLALDQEIESNMMPFISHAFTSWMGRFVFEPVRGISLARFAIVRGHSLGEKARQRIFLVAKIMLAISKSTDYELALFTPLHDQLLDSVIRAQEHDVLTKEEALKAMDSGHQLLTIITKVGSLASVLNTMALCAPIFRRLCPESSEELVNLPARLIATQVNLKFYATSDVLQSVITHRPMLFRYDIEFLSPEDEILLNQTDGPGLRWLYGVPDRLVIILARMNVLLEDHGSCIDPENIQKIEKEILACKPLISSGIGEDPILKIGRAMMQESWRLAAYVYLYMVGQLV